MPGRQVKKEARKVKIEALQYVDSRNEIVKQVIATPYFDLYSTFNTCNNTETSSRTDDSCSHNVIPDRLGLLEIVHMRMCDIFLENCELRAPSPP